METDPQKALENLHHMYGPNVELYESTRKNKKYMVKSPDGKWVHFGQKGYQDFTAHGDEKRRENFRKRNALWKNAPRWSPRHLAYWILW